MTLSQHHAAGWFYSASLQATKNSTARNLIELAVGEFDRVDGLRVRCDGVADVVGQMGDSFTFMMRLLLSDAGPFPMPQTMTRPGLTVLKPATKWPETL